MADYRKFSPLGLNPQLGLPQPITTADVSLTYTKPNSGEKSRSKNPFTAKLNIKKWDYDPTVIIEHLGAKKL
jgi:hypothetical protein